MRREVVVLVAVLAGGALPQAAEAQATGMPSFNAPYRAFQRSELAAVFSFPEVSGGSALIIPAGLSLGRRIDPKGSTVSIVPYVQPTFAFIVGDFPSDLVFGFGVGADFRLSRVLDARVSGGLGDRPLTGVSIGAVWVH